MSKSGRFDSRTTFRAARAMVRVAGAIHPQRAAEWGADLAFLQSPDVGEAGLPEAWSHLGSAPWLSARAAARRVARRDGGADAVELPAPPAGGPPGLLTHSLPHDFGEWIRDRIAGASTAVEIGSVVYGAGDFLAGDPLHVTFVREPDGSLRGLEVMGAEEIAIAISSQRLPYWRDRLEASRNEVTILGDEEQEELLALAHRAADHFPAFRDEEEEVVASIPFISGSPLLRGKGA